MNVLSITMAEESQQNSLHISSSTHGRIPVYYFYVSS